MKVTVVNMIPQSMSGETHQDSEPNLAVNPNNTNQMAATAFTLNPSGGTSAPIFVSTNGGLAWTLNEVLPGAGSFFPTYDVNSKFGGTSNILYTGVIRQDTEVTSHLRQTNYTSSSAPTDLIDNASLDDQPWVQATTATGVSGSPDRVFVGSNDLTKSGKTATITQSQSAATAAPPAGFSKVVIASRTAGGGQNGPSVRPTIHSSGTVYAAYFNWSAFSGSLITADVVVCRDSNWGTGGYASITDPGDHLAGVRVVTGVTIPWENSEFLAQERVGSHLAIVVDPNNNQRVFVAWASYPSGTTTYTLHVRSSTNGGVNWSGDLRTVSNGVNPSLAIDGSGNVGFLYQTLTGGNTWVTNVEISSDGFTTAPAPITLASTPSATPANQFLPYLGDYAFMTAHGSVFYGVFSANNTPNHANFPNGVTYQRNANFTTHTLLNVDNATPVAVSIDPFFFAIAELNFILPISPIEPIHPITPVEPIHPISPVQPIHPIEPIHPISPVEPIHPIEPVKPISPIEPIHPIEPIEPIESIEPVEPIQKVTPESPS